LTTTTTTTTTTAKNTNNFGQARNFEPQYHLFCSVQSRTVIEIKTPRMSFFKSLNIYIFTMNDSFFVQVQNAGSSVLRDTQNPNQNKQKRFRFARTTTTQQHRTRAIFTMTGYGNVSPR
jgi:hypothetical protein